MSNPITYALSVAMNEPQVNIKPEHAMDWLALVCFDPVVTEARIAFIEFCHSNHEMQTTEEYSHELEAIEEIGMLPALQSDLVSLNRLVAMTRSSSCLRKVQQILNERLGFEG